MSDFGELYDHIVSHVEQSRLVPTPPKEPTTGTNEPLLFAFHRKSDPLTGMAAFVPSIDDPQVADQTRRLFAMIREMVHLMEGKRPDINPIPPLNAVRLDDGSVLVEWTFPDFRVGFNIEHQPDDSGWHMMSTKRLGQLTASGQLMHMERVVLSLFEFIVSNI
jgi:hypothetical protein